MLFLFSSTVCTAQTPVDSSARVHSVKKATILSAILPGAGQVYNHKIWKVPIIYAAFAGMGVVIKYDNEKYKKYNSALIDRYSNDSTKVNNYPTLSNEQLRTRSDLYHRGRDYAIVITTLLYVLNIIDAHVDAHLFYFDVSDNLGLLIQPTIINNNSASTTLPHCGINLQLQFR